MALVVRYGGMRYDSSVIAVIGAGDEFERKQFYDNVAKINRQYRKKDFVSVDAYHFGALRVSRLFTDSARPSNLFFAQFAELDLKDLGGVAKDNCLVLEKRLNNKFGDSCKRHLVVEDKGSFVDVVPGTSFFWDGFGRDYEVKNYLNGSFDEFVKGKK
jgi:hypothetical protein